jgi:hypothetical protein
MKRSIWMLAISITTLTILLSQMMPTADALGQFNRDLYFSDSIDIFTPGIIFANSGNSWTPCANGFNNPACTIETHNLDVHNALGPCDADLSSPCIENIWAQTTTGPWIAGEYAGERIPPWSMYSFGTDPKYELSPARSTNLYRFPGIKHDKGDLFEVVPNFQRGIINGELQMPFSLSTAIQGVYLDSSDLPPAANVSKATTGTALVAEYHRCIDSNLALTKSCWKPGSQTDRLSFRITFRLPSLPAGWVTGRLLNPQIAYERVPGATKEPVRVTISGGSLPTPFLEMSYFYSEPNEQAVWNKLTTVFGLPWTDPYSEGPSVGPTSIDLYSKAVALDPGMDIATQVNDKWAANLTWQAPYLGDSSCATPGFMGYVGSNALTYASAIPTFDPSDGSLNYQIASPHFMPNGKVFNGDYELLLSERYARCVWGLKEVPIHATLSIVSDDGTAKVATTSIGIRDGFLGFQATGFTFSKNTIKVIIERPKPQTPSPAASPTPTQIPKSVGIPTKGKVLSITCVKGKSVKKVVGVKPVCSTGYKKR